MALTRKQFRDTLIGLGLEAGDIVHVQSDLRRIGLVDCDGTRQGMLNFYLDTFLDVIGEKGTLTVHTPFQDYGRFGSTFDVKNSPSKGGVFSEFVRRRDDAVRSQHPIVSITGIGSQAKSICGGNHRVGFGWDSPWGRLHRKNAKIVSLGLGPNHPGGTSFFHYVDNIYGSPYLYNKIYPTPVFDGDQKVVGPFVMSVRYLDFGIVYNANKLRRFLVRAGILKVSTVGDGEVMMGEADSIFDETVNQLRNDPYIMLEKPPRFRQGEMPSDGVIGGEIYLG